MKVKLENAQSVTLSDELWAYIFSLFRFRHELTPLKNCSKQFFKIAESPALSIPYADLDYSKKIKSIAGSPSCSLSMENCFALLPDNTFLTTDGAALYRIPLRLGNSSLMSLSKPVPFKGHKDTITALCLLSPQRAMTGCADGTLFLWDIQREPYINSPYGHSNCAITQIIKIDDDKIISAAKDKTLKLWSLENRTFEQLALFQEPVNHLIKIDDTRIACVIDSETMGIFDIIKRQWQFTPLRYEQKVISQLCLIAPNTLLVALNDNYEKHEVKLYDISQNSFIETLSIRNHKPKNFAASVYPLPNNQLAFISSQGINIADIIKNKTLTIYSLNSKEFVAQYSLKSSRITGLCKLKDHRLVTYNNKFTLFSFARENNKQDLDQETTSNLSYP
jgi:WD40 repeat protein